MSITLLKGMGPLRVPQRVGRGTHAHQWGLTIGFLSVDIVRSHFLRTQTDSKENMSMTTQASNFMSTPSNAALTGTGAKEDSNMDSPSTPHSSRRLISIRSQAGLAANSTVRVECSWPQISLHQFLSTSNSERSAHCGFLCRIQNQHTIMLHREGLGGNDGDLGLGPQTESKIITDRFFHTL